MRNFGSDLCDIQSLRMISLNVIPSSITLKAWRIEFGKSFQGVSGLRQMQTLFLMDVKSTSGTMKIESETLNIAQELLAAV